MTERERIIEDILKAFNKVPSPYGHSLVRGVPEYHYALADAALRVIESPRAKEFEDYSRVCTCGQNGFPENSPHSNHPHTKSCPQYTGKYE